MEGDRHNKIAKQITIIITIWIPAHVGLKGNEKADILAKDGAKNGTPLDYSLQRKDAYRILKQTQREEWNNWYVLNATEKKKANFELAPKIEPELWYRNTKLSSDDTRTVNRIITTYTYTPNWLAKMGVASWGCAISAKKKWEYNTFYTPA
jgi:hypothetical protein